MPYNQVSDNNCKKKTTYLEDGEELYILSNPFTLWNSETQQSSDINTISPTQSIAGSLQEYVESVFIDQPDLITSDLSKDSNFDFLFYNMDSDQISKSKTWAHYVQDYFSPGKPGLLKANISFDWPNKKGTNTPASRLEVFGDQTFNVPSRAENLIQKNNNNVANTFRFDDTNSATSSSTTINHNASIPYITVTEDGIEKNKYIFGAIGRKLTAINPTKKQGSVPEYAPAAMQGLVLPFRLPLKFEIYIKFYISLIYKITICRGNKDIEHFIDIPLFDHPDHDANFGDGLKGLATSEYLKYGAPGFYRIAEVNPQIEMTYKEDSNSFTLTKTILKDSFRNVADYRNNLAVPPPFSSIPADKINDKEYISNLKIDLSIMNNPSFVSPIPSPRINGDEAGEDSAITQLYDSYFSGIIEERHKRVLNDFGVNEKGIIDKDKIKNSKLLELYYPNIFEIKSTGYVNRNFGRNQIFGSEGLLEDQVFKKMCLVDIQVGKGNYQQKNINPYYVIYCRQLNSAISDTSGSAPENQHNLPPVVEKYGLSQAEREVLHKRMFDFNFLNNEYRDVFGNQISLIIPPK